jgi:hypothetical protein
MNTLSFIGSLTVTGSSEITSSNASYNGYTILTNNLTDRLLSSSIFNNFTASYNTGSFRGSFTGSLNGTSSVALTASFIATSSYVSSNIGFTTITNPLIYTSLPVISNPALPNRSWFGPDSGGEPVVSNVVSQLKGYLTINNTPLLLEQVFINLISPFPTTPGYTNLKFDVWRGAAIAFTGFINTGSSGIITFTPSSSFSGGQRVSYTLTNNGSIPVTENIIGSITSYFRET